MEFQKTKNQNVNNSEEDLILYQKTYTFLKNIFSDIKELPREYKFTVWEKIKDALLDVLLKIYEANALEVSKREPYIKFILNKIKYTTILIKLLRDLKVIWLTKFIEYNNSLLELKKITFWWKKIIDSQK